MARRQQFELLNNVSATGNGADIDWPGGYGEVTCEGTFGGATVTLKKKTPQGTYLSLGSNVTFTTNGIGGIMAAAGPMRMEVSGGTPSSLYAYITGIPQN